MRLSETPFHGPADRRSALDRAHRGDIEGALGTIASHDTAPRRSRARRLRTLAVVAGPGLIVLAADNDAGGLAVYSEAGQDHGLGLLWVLALLAPILFVNQEMVARLGAVTGAGHARLILERFGRRWGAFALGDLLLLNLLTIATQFIGVTLALGHFGVSRYVAVPAAIVVLVAVGASGSYRRWERALLALVAVNLLLVPLIVLAHPRPSAVALDGGPGTAATGAVLLVIALVGTTVAPWQLFLQQSLVVDKRISARWLPYARADTLIGTIVVLLGAAAVIVTCARAFDGTALAGGFTDAGAVADGLATVAGGAAGTLFAVLLLNASLLGAAAVTLSGAYAVGEVLGVKHSLHRGWRDARVFHAIFAVTVVLGGLVVLIPGAPLGAITTGVQALAGVLLPSAAIFLLLLCNDEVVLGPWTNPLWVNVVATVSVGLLVTLSGLLTITTVFPQVDVTTVALVLAGVVTLVFAAWAVLLVVEARGRRGPELASPWERRTWTMPPIEMLPPPTPSRARTLGLLTLRGYLLVAAVAVVIKAIEAGG